MNSQESDDLQYIGLHRLSLFPVKHTIHLKSEAFSVSEKKKKNDPRCYNHRMTNPTNPFSSDSHFLLCLR